MSGFNFASRRKPASGWMARLAALALVCAMATGGTIALPSSAAAQDAPVSSSGRVHYDHYRDRGGERWHHRERRPGWNDRRSDRREHRSNRRGDRNSSGTVIQGDRRGGSAAGGTFTGNISAYRDRGNGVYFRIEGDGYHGGPAASAAPRASGPRVIEPSASSGCVDENGVCVIRPGQ